MTPSAGVHSLQTYSAGTIQLTPGPHAVSILYNQVGGSAGVILKYGPPTTAQGAAPSFASTSTSNAATVVPASWFSHVAPPPSPPPPVNKPTAAPTRPTATPAAPVTQQQGSTGGAAAPGLAVDVFLGDGLPLPQARVCCCQCVVPHGRQEAADASFRVLTNVVGRVVHVKY